MKGVLPEPKDSRQFQLRHLDLPFRSAKVDQSPKNTVEQNDGAALVAATRIWFSR